MQRRHYVFIIVVALIVFLDIAYILHSKKVENKKVDTSIEENTTSDEVIQTQEETPSPTQKIRRIKTTNYRHYSKPLQIAKVQKEPVSPPQPQKAEVKPTPTPRANSSDFDYMATTPLISYELTDTKIPAISVNGDKPKKLFKFAFITGINIGKKENKGEKIYPEEWFKRAQLGSKARGADFIIIGGDIINENYDPQLFGKFNELINTQLPILFVPGDNELGNSADSITQDKLDIWLEMGYTEKHTSEYYGVVYKGTAIYLLNTLTQRSSNPGLRDRFDAQLADMDAFFTKNEDVPFKILCGHYPVYINEQNEGNQESNIDLPYRTKLLSLMQKHKIRYYFAGHLNADSVCDVKGIVIFNNPPLSFLTENTKKRGFIMYTLTDKGLKREFYPVDETVDAKGLY